MLVELFTKVSEKIEKKIDIEKKSFQMEIFMNDYILNENAFMMHLMNNNKIM
jgi:hypothetical protein